MYFLPLFAFPEAVVNPDSQIHKCVEFYPSQFILNLLLQTLAEIIGLPHSSGCLLHSNERGKHKL